MTCLHRNVEFATAQTAAGYALTCADCQTPIPDRHRAPEGDCRICDGWRRENIEFHPDHYAMPTCRSGRRPHCTCRTCF